MTLHFVCDRDECTNSGVDEGHYESTPEDWFRVEFFGKGFYFCSSDCLMFWAAKIDVESLKTTIWEDEDE